MTQHIQAQDGDGWFRDSSGNLVLKAKNTTALTVSGGGNVTVPGTLTVTGAVAQASHTVLMPLPLGAWTDDASAGPAAATAGVAAAKAFETDADDIMRITFPVPADWDGASDLTLKLAWANEAGTVIAFEETVTFALAWRSKAAGALFDAGDAGAATVTYEEADEEDGTDKAIHVSDVTIDFDNEDQPVAAGDTLMLELRRDVSADDYGADAVLIDAWLAYSSVA